MTLEVGQVLRVAMRMQGTQSQDIINVWHVRCTTLVDGTSEDVADDMVAELSTNYQDLEAAVSSSQVGADISIQNVITAEVLGTHLWNPVFLGTLGGDALPPQTSLFTLFRTGFSRRIGRKFWGITTEGSQGDGLVTPAIVTQMTTLLANFIGPWVGTITGNTYYFGVYNENFGVSFVDFTEGVFKTRLMIQKRRRPQIGS